MISQRTHLGNYFYRTPVKSIAAVILSLLFSFESTAQIKERPILIGTVSRGFGVHYTSRGLRDGLKQLGYKEFEDYVIGDFYTNGSNERLEPILDQMVSNGSHIIITMNEQATLAGRKYREEIPLLFSSVSDPVGMGLVNSYSKPDQGMSGVADLDHELDLERLKRFKQLMPKLDKVLYAYQPGTETEQRINNLKQSAEATGITLVEQPLVSQDGADAFFLQIRPGDYDAILSPNNASLGLMGLSVEASQRTGIPALAHTADVVEYGAVASYGASYHAAGFQLARMVEKVVNGIEPDEIPVEVNRTFEFVINLAVAKKLGLQIPPDVLYQADRVVR